MREVAKTCLKISILGLSSILISGIAVYKSVGYAIAGVLIATVLFEVVDLMFVPINLLILKKVTDIDKTGMYMVAVVLLYGIEFFTIMSSIYLASFYYPYWTLKINFFGYFLYAVAFKFVDSIMEKKKETK